MAWGPSASPRHQQAVKRFWALVASGTLTAQSKQIRLEEIVRERVAELQAIRPLTSVQAYRGRVRGVWATVLRAGDRAWGRWMHGKRMGKANALHGLEHLRRIGPGAREAARIARERKQARQQWEREHPSG